MTFLLTACPSPSARRPGASAKGEAAIRDFVTSLEATIDLRSLKPGAYELAVRRQDDERWLVPAQVKSTAAARDLATTQEQSRDPAT